jgi:hypothetical protein
MAYSGDYSGVDEGFLSGDLVAVGKDYEGIEGVRLLVGLALGAGFVGVWKGDDEEGVGERGGGGEVCFDGLDVGVGLGGLGEGAG